MGIFVVDETFLVVLKVVFAPFKWKKVKLILVED